ncbi:MAG: biotin-dependent carboxyltransferase family protein [Mycobacteriales bacterium]|nr:MAG: allophanate hydrolase [Pseudonocardiales bacterium]
MITVVEPGPLTTVQDEGRAGLAHLGVPTAGPADWVSHTLANRLVANPASAAALECTVSGPTLRFDDDARIAAVGARLVVDGETMSTERTIAVRAGQRVVVGRTAGGVRCYVAVAGGFDVTSVLDSRSTDTLAGIGPRALEAGDRLSIGDVDASTVDSSFALRTGWLSSPGADVRVVVGPHEHWFDDFTQLLDADYAVTRASDRVGVRLAGPALGRSRPGEIATCGVVAGAIQVPPDGVPIVLLANHAATGGYPIVGVVCRADLPALGRCAPGDGVSFVAVGRAEALAAYAALTRRLDTAVVRL